MAEDGGTPNDGAGNKNGDGGGEGPGAEEGGAGNDPPAFHEMLPEDLREDPSLKDFKDVGGLAKSYIHAQKMVGSLGNDPDRLVQMPGEDATDDDIAEFYNKLGRPEEASAYELNYDEESPAKIQGEFVDQYKEWAHEAGLTPKQAQVLMDKYSGWAEGIVEQSNKDYNEVRDQNEKVLQDEFGGEYDNKVALAGRAAKELGGDEFMDLMEETGLGNDPRVVKTFAKIGEMLSEDELGAGGGGSQFGMTPAHAKAELSELSMDGDFQKALMDPENPGHKAAIERRSRLYKAAYPDNN